MNEKSILKPTISSNYIVGMPHTWLTSMKRFTNLKVNLMVQKVQTCNFFYTYDISYEFEYSYQCITTFQELRDSKGPILMR